MYRSAAIVAWRAMTTPLTGLALRDLVFCGGAAALGLCGAAISLAVAGLPLAALILVSRPGVLSATPSSPARKLAVLAALTVLLVTVVLAPQVGRLLGAAQRGLAARLLDEHIEPPRPFPGRSVLRRPLAGIRDGAVWKTATYMLLKLPVTLGECYALFLVITGTINMSFPLWWGLFRHHKQGTTLSPVSAFTPFGPFQVGTFAGALAACAAGAGMVAAAPWAARACTAADRWLMQALLGPGRLALRVADLEQTRALAIEDSAAMLRRLERDLHDGAQVRLATLAMSLGMAREKLAADVGADPAIVELVEAAHGNAKDALVDLRNLARGIHPPVLDNGLGDALQRREQMRVVIAEDAALFREGLTRLLADRGHEVVAAVADGDELISAVARHRPDVAVVDIRMPPTHVDDLSARSSAPAVTSAESAL